MIVRARATCFCASQASAVRTGVAGVSMDHDDEALPQSRSVSPPRVTDRYGRKGGNGTRRTRAKGTVPEEDGGSDGGPWGADRERASASARLETKAPHLDRSDSVQKGQRATRRSGPGTAGQRAYLLERQTSTLEMCAEDLLESKLSSAVDAVVSGRFRNGTIPVFLFVLDHRPSRNNIPCPNSIGHVSRVSSVRVASWSVLEARSRWIGCRGNESMLTCLHSNPEHP